MSKIIMLNSNKDIEKRIISIEQEPITPPAIQTTVEKIRACISKIETQITALEDQKNGFIDILEQINKDEKIPNIPTRKS